MAHRLVRVRAVSVGVTALLLFQSANQLPNAVAATASPLSGEATVLGREDQPTEVGAVPVLQRPGGGSGIDVGGVGADVQPRPVFPPYHPPSQPTDVPGLRDAHQDVTANPDGTYTATVSQAKINYLDNFGLWQPIDRRLIASTDATYDLKIAANNVGLLVSDAHGSSGAAALSSGDLVVKLRLPGYGAATAASPTTTPSASAEPSDSPSSPPSLGPSDAPSTSGPVQDVTPTLVPAPSDPTASPAASTAPDPSADGSESAAPSAAPSNTPDPTSTPIPSASGVAASAPIESPTPPPQRGPDITSISFPGASGRPDATVGSTDEGFEFGAIFRGPTDPPVFNAVIDLGGLSATLAPDGQTVVLTETTTGDGQSAVTTTVGRISIPGLHDADGAGATGADLSVTIVESGSTSLPDGVGPDLVAGLAPTEVILSYAIAPSYLADPLRIYPVTLDPTVCIANSVSGCTSGAFDHFIGSGIATTYPTGWTTFRVGYEFARPGLWNLARPAVLPRRRPARRGGGHGRGSSTSTSAPNTAVHPAKRCMWIG